MIEIKDNTPPPAGRRVVAAYITDEKRHFGLVHALDLRRADVSAYAQLGVCGLIRQIVLCTCTAPNPPYHIKPLARCVFVQLGNWFVTIRYWF